MEYGKDFIQILILESGDILKQKGMECILGKMGTGTRANGRCA